MSVIVSKMMDNDLWSRISTKDANDHLTHAASPLMMLRFPRTSTVLTPVSILILGGLMFPIMWCMLHDKCSKKTPCQFWGSKLAHVNCLNKPIKMFPMISLTRYPAHSICHAKIKPCHLPLLQRTYCDQQ